MRVRYLYLPNGKELIKHTQHQSRSTFHLSNKKLKCCPMFRHSKNTRIATVHIFMFHTSHIHQIINREIMCVCCCGYSFPFWCASAKRDRYRLWKYHKHHFGEPCSYAVKSTIHSLFSRLCVYLLRSLWHAIVSIVGTFFFYVFFCLARSLFSHFDRVFVVIVGLFDFVYGFDRASKS